MTIPASQASSFSGMTGRKKRLRWRPERGGDPKEGWFIQIISRCDLGRRWFFQVHAVGLHPFWLSDDDGGDVGVGGL